MRRIVYSKSSLKTLRRMPRDQAQRILLKVDRCAADPASLGNNVKKLAGSPYLRLRVGDWRIIMDDQNRVLSVLSVGQRGSIYE